MTLLDLISGIKNRKIWLLNWKRETGNGERGTGNRERESGNECARLQ